MVSGKLFTQAWNRVEALIPGQYRVETSLDGFDAPAHRAAIEAGQTLTIDITLTPSRISEAVVVAQPERRAEADPSSTATRPLATICPSSAQRHIPTELTCRFPMRRHRWKTPGARK